MAVGVGGVVAPSLVVAATWLVVGLVVAGCGLLARRALAAVAAEPQPAALQPADLWIGLAVLLAYLQAWNLIWPVDPAAWLLPAAVALVGLVRADRHPLRAGLSRRTLLAGGLVGLGALWVADTALGVPGDSDDGLYHLGIVEYAQHYATIPGLGNLADRLAAGDAHLLLVALLDQGPWARAGWHLADGLLATMLFVELGVRLAAPGGAPSFTRRLSALLVPATIVCIAIRPSHRITSPNLDFAAYVLVVVGLLYLADCVENGAVTHKALAALATLAAASVTRPLYWIPALLALVSLALLGRGRRAAGAAMRLRRLAAVAVLPALLAAGWMTRQAILSGYPLFPLTIGAVPAGWRMPASAVSAAVNGDDAWARDPNLPASQVLGSWSWVTAYWLPYVRDDADVVLPLTFLSCLVPSLIAGRGRDPGRRSRTPALLSVLVPSLAVLAVWFLTAPDPRFVFAPLWLVPIALAAWALPPLRRPRAASLLAAAAVGAALCAGLGEGSLGRFAWLAPVEAAGWAYLAGMWRVVRRRGSGAAVAQAALVSVLVTAIGVSAGRQHGFQLVVANRNGPFGVPLEPTPTVRAVRSPVGLRVWEPVRGGDCYEILLCTPAVPGISPRLHLRGTGVSSGFSVS